MRVYPIRTLVDSRLKQVGYWLEVAVMAIVLLVGSAIPMPPHYNPDFGRYGPDKALHLAGHAGLAATLVTALSDDTPSVRDAVLAVILSTAYGVCTERLQEYVPGREFERGDVAAGLIGSVLAVQWKRMRARRDTGRSGR